MVTLVTPVRCAALRCAVAVLRSLWQVPGFRCLLSCSTRSGRLCHPAMCSPPAAPRCTSPPSLRTPPLHRSGFGMLGAWLSEGERRIYAVYRNASRSCGRFEYDSLDTLASSWAGI